MPKLLAHRANGHSTAAPRRVNMRLHYYTPAVPESYCVGIHNGHGFGSLFARLFSKVAAKTAAKAAVKVAKVAGRKALKVVTTKGAAVAKKAAKQAYKEAAKGVKTYATEKIADWTEKGLKSKVPDSFVHSVSAAATRGVNAADKAVHKVDVNALIDKGAKHILGVEPVAGVKRRKSTAPSVAKIRKTAHRRNKTTASRVAKIRKTAPSRSKSTAPRISDKSLTTLIDQDE